MTARKHHCTHCEAVTVSIDPPTLCPDCGKPSWIGDVEAVDEYDAERTIQMIEEVARRAVDGNDVLRAMRCAAWARAQAELHAAMGAMTDESKIGLMRDIIRELVDVINEGEYFD